MNRDSERKQKAAKKKQDRERLVQFLAEQREQETQRKFKAQQEKQKKLRVQAEKRTQLIEQEEKLKLERKQEKLRRRSNESPANNSTWLETSLKKADTPTPHSPSAITPKLGTITPIEKIERISQLSFSEELLNQKQTHSIPIETSTQLNQSGIILEDLKTGKIFVNQSTTSDQISSPGSQQIFRINSTSKSVSIKWRTCDSSC